MTRTVGSSLWWVMQHDVVTGVVAHSFTNLNIAGLGAARDAEPCNEAEVVVLVVVVV